MEAPKAQLAPSSGQAAIYSATPRPASPVTVVRLGPNIVVANRVLARSTIEATHAQYGGVVIADLTDVGYIDASGLGALVTARKRIRFAGGDLELAGLNEDLRSLLEGSHVRHRVDQGGQARERLPRSVFDVRDAIGYTNDPTSTPRLTPEQCEDFRAYCARHLSARSAELMVGLIVDEDSIELIAERQGRTRQACAVARSQAIAALLRALAA